MVDAFIYLLSPFPFTIMICGVLLGIMVGVLPGITAGMMMALVLPFTYYMTSVNAVTLLVAIFVGGVSGGLITATLMRIPGEPNAIMTCLDGHALAKAGHPGRALGLGNAGSIVGGAMSWVALVLLAPPLARLAIALGPWENFAIVCVALMLIASLSSGSLLPGLMAALFGVLLSLPGVDESSGTLRLTFGFHQLDAGLDVMPVMIGLFALSQILADTLNIEKQDADRVRANMRGILMSVRDYARHGWNMLRSSAIGIAMGVLPGVGATIASIVAYTTAKNLSATPEQFGKGSEEAIVAAETANNATTGGTLIPLLTLGIPGGLTDAILLGALTIHNLQPGPLLYLKSPQVVNTIMATHLFAHVVMFVFMTIGIMIFARLMLLSRAWLFPTILVFCVIGAYVLNNRPLDPWVMLVFGLIGVGLEFARVPLAPFLIGFLLGPLAEKELRSGLMSSGGDLSAILERPITMGLLALAVAMGLWPLLRHRRRERLAAIGSATKPHHS
jgi:putative tricarboxylic transport membrane protein